MVPPVLASSWLGLTGEFMVPLGTISENQMTECFAEQFQALADSGADSISVETMTDLNEAKAALRAAKTSCGLPEAVDRRTVFRESPEQMADSVPGLVDAGARHIGGCWGTTPAHIRRVRSRIHALRWPRRR